jgi:LPS O-antigen subunit length determinant protein (WzzB/FepE family)
MTVEHKYQSISQAESDLESVNVQYIVQNEDDTSLLEIWQALVSRKKLIFIITTLFLLTALIAVWLWPKTWRAETQFMPPLSENTQLMNIEGTNTLQYTPDNVYQAFLLNYQSVLQKRKFFKLQQLEKYYIQGLSNDSVKRAEQLEAAFQEFNLSLDLELPQKKAKLFYVKSILDFPDQEKSAEYLNQYTQRVHIDTLNNIIQTITERITQKKSYLEKQIESKLKTAKQLREDRISALDEAIIIAKQLDINRGDMLFLRKYSQSDHLQGDLQGDLQDDLQGDLQGKPQDESLPLYLLGYEWLQAEKKALQERKMEVPFIKNLRELLGQRALLNEQLDQIRKTGHQFKAVRIDQPASVPNFPWTPRIKLIVVITTLLGFMVSLITIFVLNIRAYYQRKLPPG